MAAEPPSVGSRGQHRWRTALQPPPGDDGISHEKSKATAVASTVVVALFAIPYLCSSFGLWQYLFYATNKIGSTVQSIPISTGWWIVLLPLCGCLVLVASAGYLAVTGSGHMSDRHNSGRFRNIFPHRRYYNTSGHMRSSKNK